MNIFEVDPNDDVSYEAIKATRRTPIIKGYTFHLFFLVYISTFSDRLEIKEDYRK